MSKTLFLGKKIIELDSVDSTNNYAANLISQTKVLDGTVIMAYFQSQGRGQRGNDWMASPGENLTISIIVSTSFVDIGNQFVISQAVSLGVCKYVEQRLGCNGHVKWPNDIYVDGKKIAGILIENQFTGKSLSLSILGIGLNVNQSNFGQLSNATSLKLISSETYDLNEELEDLLKQIELYYLKLRRKDFEGIRKEYLDNLMFHGDYRRYSANGEVFTAMILDVMPNGNLILRQQDGKIRSFTFKEVEFIL